MSDLVELGPVRCSELAAPAISRAFVAGMRAGGLARQLVERYGGAAVGYVIDLRNPLAAGRSLSPDELAAVYRYVDPSTRQDTIAASVTGGLLEGDADGVIRTTERGRQFLDELYDHHASVLSDRWDANLVERLNPLLQRLLGAAGATAGAAWAVQAPPFERTGLEQAVVLLNRLSTMRYHRADAHAAAWRAAGWTADEVAAMPWGARWSDERLAIEQDTNVRAAPPYEALAPDERLVLIAAMGRAGLTPNAMPHGLPPDLNATPTSRFDDYGEHLDHCRGRAGRRSTESHSTCCRARWHAPSRAFGSVRSGR